MDEIEDGVFNDYFEPQMDKLYKAVNKVEPSLIKNRSRLINTKKMRLISRIFNI